MASRESAVTDRAGRLAEVVTRTSAVAAREGAVARVEEAQRAHASACAEEAEDVTAAVAAMRHKVMQRRSRGVRVS